MKTQVKTQKNENIYLKGVSTHNLKTIDVEIPLGLLTVVSGVSGSGKSSLVYGTLYAESYRRYLESLSSFARQYLKALPKPEVEEVRNLPPAIAVRQSRQGHNKRSTVGTLTEINDLLKILYTHISDAFCPSCDSLITTKNISGQVQDLLTEGDGEQVLICAPLKIWEKLSADEFIHQLQQQGFKRVFLDCKVLALSKVSSQDIFRSEVIVDRVRISDEQIERVQQSLKVALQLAKGPVFLRWGDEYQEQKGISARPYCFTCETLIKEPYQSMFSFNHPQGACDNCQGFGEESFLDWDKVFPDKSLSIVEEGIAALNFGKHVGYYDVIKKAAKTAGFSIEKNFSEYSKEEWQWIKSGDSLEISEEHINKNHKGKKATKKKVKSKSQWRGMQDYFDWLDSKKYKPHYRIHRARFISYRTCQACAGLRFNKQALSYRITGRNVAQTQSLSVLELKQFIVAIQEQKLKKLNKESHFISSCSEAIDEILARVNYLCQIGLSYLSLNRLSMTLSGGELQRIHMARCLGSALTDTMFCLDEPTAGLHAKDSLSLLNFLYQLRDLGNTVVVVEHDQSIINGADHVLLVGPKAGSEGGRVYKSYCPAKNLVKNSEKKTKKSTSLLSAGETSAPLTLKKSNVKSKNSELKTEHSLSKYISLEIVSVNNLKSISAFLPLGGFTVVCGVSGCGKSTLINQVLYPLLNHKLGQQDCPDDLKASQLKMVGFQKKNLGGVYQVDQSPLARSSRSNLATYLKIFEPIRKIFSQVSSALKLGLVPGSFSFNVKGGRCEACQGLGLIQEDMSFLGEVKIVCSECNGKRFNDDVLSVRYRGFNLIEILSLTVDEAAKLFADQKKIYPVLAKLQQVGMGYMVLGQETSSFSGGEAQRLKLLNILLNSDQEQNGFFILDEPTTGLADSDVEVFLKFVKEIHSQGHTILIVEHHLDVIRAADWLLELGPGPGPEGGDVLYCGPGKGVLKASRSVIKDYL